MKTIFFLFILSFLCSCADLRTQGHWNNRVEEGQTRVTVKNRVLSRSTSGNGNQWNTGEGEVTINKKNKIKSYGISIGNN